MTLDQIEDESPEKIREFFSELGKDMSEKIRQEAFSNGRPIVYMNEQRQVVQEWSDGRIVVLKQLEPLNHDIQEIKKLIDNFQHMQVFSYGKYKDAVYDGITYCYGSGDGIGFSGGEGYGGGNANASGSGHGYDDASGWGSGAGKDRSRTCVSFGRGDGGGEGNGNG